MEENKGIMKIVAIEIALKWTVLQNQDANIIGKV